ncbi:hypothetical protein, partial [Heyndrickxia sporothermodurans]
HAAAMADATNALFSAGDQAVLQAATKQAASEGLGGTIGCAFCFRPEVIDRLPVVLRILIGCAEVIHADLSGWDFIEILPDEICVRAFRSDDPSRPLPRIFEAVDVDLRRRRSKRARPADTVLYLKSRYFRLDEPQRALQAAIDERLIEAGLLDPNGKGPPGQELQAILSARTVPRI